MKKFSKILALLLALGMLFTLVACGETVDAPVDVSPEVSDDAPVESPVEPETPSIAGTYRFKMIDKYGDATSFTVTLKEGGEYNIMTAGAMGSALYTGTWTDNGDGTYTTGAADAKLSVDWLEEDGSAIWAIDGSNTTPINYVEPTEFEEKSAITDPASAMECVGVYTFSEVNAERGSTTPWVVWVNADGTYRFWRDNSFLGLRGFSGTWTYAEENVVDFSAAVFDEEGADPVGDWFTDDWASSWALYGDGTAVPVGYEGSVVDISVNDLSDDTLCADGYEYVGIYTFAEVNAERGSVTPWVIWLNADGTYRFWRDNSFLGLRGFSGTWTYVGEGVFDFSAAVFDEEGADPVGSWFADDWSSTWTFYTDGTCVPDGYDSTITAIDKSSLSDSSLILA